MRTANIISPAVRRDAREFKLRERTKLEAELREKYHAEPDSRWSKGWRRLSLQLRIRLEAERILRYRLYLRSRSAAPGLESK